MERLSAAPHQDRLVPAALVEAPPSPNGHHHEPDSTPVYNTGLGPLTFEQLYHQTSRAVGYVMRERYSMRNPEDVDDCMQAGYLKVWQQLEQNPNCLADKPKSYIVQAVVFGSKVERFSHQRHYHKIVYDARSSVGGSQPQLSTGRVDTWMDLAQALHQVAYTIEDDPLMLLSLYTFITQAKATDISDTFGVNYKTLAKRRPHTRALLAEALPHYQPAHSPSQNGQGEHPPQQTACTIPMVSPWLLEDKPALWPEVESAPALRTETLEAHYPTAWAGRLTLAQILDDAQVRRVALAKAVRLGLAAADQADCIQNGSIQLWQKLQTDPTLLADKGPAWVGLYLTYSGDPKQFHRHQQRQRRFADPDFDWQDADEYLRLGLTPTHTPHHAGWTREIDEQIDVAAFIDTVRQHYADCPRKWIAFQAVAGLMTAKEAAQMLGMNQKNFAAGISNELRQELQALLPESMKDAFPETWEAQLARGEGVDHITEIAQEVMHDQRLLLALYVVTTSASKKAVAQTFGYGLTAFGQDIRKIKAMIAQRYRRDRLRQA